MLTLAIVFTILIILLGGLVWRPVRNYDEDRPVKGFRAVVALLLVACVASAGYFWFNSGVISGNSNQEAGAAARSSEEEVKLVATFTAQPSATDTTIISFDATGSTTSDGAAYLWNFDGNIVGGLSLKIDRQLTPGDHAVAFSVIKGDKISEDKQTIAVKAQPCATWPMSTKTPDNHDWVQGGVDSIRNAKTDAEAKAAAYDWIEKIKVTNGTLAGAYSFLLGKTVDASTLSANGCATAAAQAVVTELQMDFAVARITVAEVPTGATNSGTVDGTVYAGVSPGIDGDRTAIRIEMPNKIVWIMARCGNAAVEGPPPVPTHPGIPVPPPQTPPAGCTPVALPSNKYYYIDATMCYYAKYAQTFDQQQNGSPADQQVQNNTTSGVDTGPTTDGNDNVVLEPAPAPQAPAPVEGQAPPANNGTGFNTGGGTGSSPGGSSTDTSGTSGGGSVTPADPPVDTNQGGSGNNTDPGGF